MEWSNDMCLNLIDHYEQQSILWDPKHPYHYSKKKKLEAWMCIASNLNMDVAIVQKKMNSLLGSFRAQKSKAKISVGNGQKDVYVSKWFAFERMGFLLDKDNHKNITDTEIKNFDVDEGNASELYEGAITSENDEDAIEEEGENNFDTGINEENISLKLEKPSVKRAKSHENHSVGEAYKILINTNEHHKASQLQSSSDHFFIFGQYVGKKLQTYSMRTAAFVEHRISNILFEADMGQYETTDSHNQDFHSTPDQIS